MENNKNSERKNVVSKKVVLIGIPVFVILAVALAIFLTRTSTENSEPELVSISRMVEDIAAGEVVKIEDIAFNGELLLHYKNGETRQVLRDTHSSLLEQLNYLGLSGEQLSQIQIEVVKGQSGISSTPATILLVLGILGLPVLVAFAVSRRERAGKKAFQTAGIPNTRFTDVAGLDENLQELQDIVTFLKEGDRYEELGAKMPRGILMVGDPGTGKTLIARALAGEAGVPFYATSGSEFIEVFVGVGASRMRSLFKKAKENAPCIIFIDEIDAVGRARHRSESGAEAEQDQTLNQLLVEMDGFDTAEGVIVLAATNRVDILDSALTRPGRFDRRVHVYHPDVKGRHAILQVHVKGKRLGADVCLENVAKATPGMVGADLANIVNEAAISAVRNGNSDIQMMDFEEAVEKVIAGGVQRKSYVMSEEEKQIVAFHEAGHAVVMHGTELSDPVHKITIIPRGQAGGYTMALPEQEQILISRRKILARITGLLGGRAAEEIFFQDVTSGASNDLTVATQLAEEMVMRLGMDREAGLRVFNQGQARSIFSFNQNSQKRIEAIDEAVNHILEECYAQAKHILLENRTAVENVARELLDVETLQRDRFVELVSS